MSSMSSSSWRRTVRVARVPVVASPPGSWAPPVPAGTPGGCSPAGRWGSLARCPDSRAHCGRWKRTTRRGKRHAEFPALVAVADTVLAAGAAGLAAVADRMGDLDSISYPGHRLRGRIRAAPEHRDAAGAIGGRRAPPLVK